MPDSQHTPVLMAQCLDLLRPEPGGRFIDCTVNGGGHSAAILEQTAPDGPLLAIDADADAVAVARQRLAPYAERARVLQSNFRSVGLVARSQAFDGVDGVIFDLGLSTNQIDALGRGFSFSRDEPLDMRFDPTAGTSAADYLATASIQEIEATLRTYGEEPRARRIAAEIVGRRASSPITTTGQLADLVSRVLGRRGRLHPATRVFQALRIAVNDELHALAEALPQSVSLLRSGGRVAIISFHSLEDRLVKNFFRRLAGLTPDHTARGIPVPPSRPIAEVRILTPRPVSPTAAEVADNPRSRSARLRVAERI